MINKNEYKIPSCMCEQALDGNPITIIIRIESIITIIIITNNNNNYYNYISNNKNIKGNK
jgi:hypothetical protein